MMTTSSKTPPRISAGIIGVSGYSGIEMARLISGHPVFSLRWASSDRWAGKVLREKVAFVGAVGALVVSSQADAREKFSGTDVVFLCTPPEASIELAPKLLAAGVRVVDLSGGFRLAAHEYPAWYGFDHAEPQLLDEAIYCLPEATPSRDRLASARLVSNPGCYPTASALALLPLLRADLIETDGLIVDAKSGATGAGRKATEALSFCEVSDDVRAYGVLKHKHTPEIENILALAGFPGLSVTFTPHLLPVRRGIISTVYGRLKSDVRQQDDVDERVAFALNDFAADKPFIDVVAPEAATLRGVVGTNRVMIGARADSARGVVVSVATEDNLIKGAAGQALQNANLMFSLPETAGLAELAGYQP